MVEAVPKNATVSRRRTRHEAARGIVDKRAAAAECRAPREASMPRGEGVYGSSVDQSGKATGRIQGAGQGDPSLHPASSLLGSSPLPIKGAGGPVKVAWSARYF